MSYSQKCATIPLVEALHMGLHPMNRTAIRAPNPIQDYLGVRTRSRKLRVCSVGVTKYPRLLPDLQGLGWDSERAATSRRGLERKVPGHRKREAQSLNCVGVA